MVNEIAEAYAKRVGFVFIYVTPKPEGEGGSWGRRAQSTAALAAAGQGQGLSDLESGRQRPGNDFDARALAL